MQPKILLWDIEASNLNANYGFVFCIGYKWLGESQVKLISIRNFPKQMKLDHTNDSLVLKKFAEVMAEADLQVTHYGLRFDYPYIQTRLMIHGLPPLPNVPHVDTWRIAKYKLKLHSNRLDTVSHAIPVAQGKQRELKTPLSPEAWIRGHAGHIPSIRYIEDHCIADIKVLENSYLELRKYATSSPNVAKIINHSGEGCPNCGSFDIQLRGWNATARGRQRRAQCKSCAGWFQLPARTGGKSPVPT